jgi:hypothetical protein
MLPGDRFADVRHTPSTRIVGLVRYFFGATVRGRLPNTTRKMMFLQLCLVRRSVVKLRRRRPVRRASSVR